MSEEFNISQEETGFPLLKATLLPLLLAFLTGACARPVQCLPYIDSFVAAHNIKTDHK